MGQQKMGYYPKVTFSVGLSSWQQLPLPSAEPATLGAEPSASGSPSALPTPALFSLNLGALCGQWKPLLCRLGAMREN